MSSSKYITTNHVRQAERDSERIVRRMLRMEQAGRRPRRRPDQICGVVREDMKLVGLREEDAEDSGNGGRMSQ